MNGGAKISIKSVLLHEIIFFCLSVFSSSEVLGPFGVNCPLQLAGLGKKREKTVKPTYFSLLYVESNFGATDKSFTVFFTG